MNIEDITQIREKFLSAVGDEKHTLLSSCFAFIVIFLFVI